MKRIVPLVRRLAITALVAAAASAANAVTVLECVDQSGAMSFRDVCPPGTTKVGEREVAGEPKVALPDISETVAKNPVTLYIGPQCDACDLVRMHLQNRGVPFTEKDASTTVAIQEELQKATGGPLTVPTTQVGTEVLTGYNKQSLEGALDNAGYPPQGVLPASAPAPATPPVTEEGATAETSPEGTTGEAGAAPAEGAETPAPTEGAEPAATADTVSGTSGATPAE